MPTPISLAGDYWAGVARCGGGFVLVARMPVLPFHCPTLPGLEGCCNQTVPAIPDGEAHRPSIRITEQKEFGPGDRGPDGRPGCDPEAPPFRVPGSPWIPSTLGPGHGGTAESRYNIRTRVLTGGDSNHANPAPG